MKFAETLGAHITPTWRKQYIEYEVSLTYNILWQDNFHMNLKFD